MFFTPKPRQFTYRPRFYDPEKERWEALKQKYADERAKAALLDNNTEFQKSSVLENITTGASDEDDLAYFQRRVRELDRSERNRLTWMDAFRKREMPKFKYQPRFTDTDGQTGSEHLRTFKQSNTKIKRRFDISDTDYMKPVPTGRIMLYALLVCLLLYWILF